MVLADIDKLVLEWDFGNMKSSITFDLITFASEQLGQQKHVTVTHLPYSVYELIYDVHMEFVTRKVIHLVSQKPHIPYVLCSLSSCYV